MHRTYEQAQISSCAYLSCQPFGQLQEDEITLFRGAVKQQEWTRSCIWRICNPHCTSAEKERGGYMIQSSPCRLWQIWDYLEYKQVLLGTLSLSEL